MKRFLPFLLLIFFISLIGVSTYNLNKKQGFVDGAETDFRNPDNKGFRRIKISLPDFSLAGLFDENDSLAKDDLLGKYSIINFFASWCTTCHLEHPILLELKDKNIIDIYGVAWRDIDENTKEFLIKNKNPYKKVAKDSKGLFTNITGIRAVPETLIINKKGAVVMRYRGNLDKIAIDEIQEFLKKRQ